ncbi:hypothetical protein OS493_005621 [Desmophyllum pertusum]|uniref:Uncharacterized protein n=1 Tax=Desmophyllum pertusum TaxID=174260 RepID=A0A9W9YSM2_9CNID|nr:hypothetical protein OS493_005621 [Desmophyllum pertusum]
MAKQIKEGNMSKEPEEWVVDEKIYRLQGAIPKAKGKQGLSAIGPNIEKQRNLGSPTKGDRHFQENESRLFKAKRTPRSPQELISIDNVSLVTARQGNKLPYCRTTNSRSTPLPQWSPSKISPVRASPTKKPYSAPAKLLSEFQWPTIQEQSISAENSVDSKMSTKTKTEVVPFSYLQPQHHCPGESKKSHIDPTNKALDTEQEDEIKRRPSLMQGCKVGGLLEKRKLKAAQSCPTVSPFPKISPVRASPTKKPYSAPAQLLSEFQWPTIQEQSDSAETDSVARKKTEVAHFPHPQPAHHRQGESKKSHFDPTHKDLDIEQEDEVKRRPSLMQGGGLLQRRNLKTVQSARPVSQFPAMPGSAGQIKGEEIIKIKTMEQYSQRTSIFPQRNDGLKSEGGNDESYSSEPSIRQKISRIRLKMSRIRQQKNEREIKKVVITDKRDGKMNDTGQVENQEMQKYHVPSQKRRERFSRTENSGPRIAPFGQSADDSLDEEKFEEVFHLPISAASSWEPETVSRSQQKVMSVQHTADTANDKETNPMTDVISEAESKQDMPSGIGPRNNSPVSFVAQLIANTQQLTLNDSIESPALQERKKLARTLKKKFG